MSNVPLGIKKTATICVLKNGDSFLLLKRLKEPNKDLYTPIGGKLDPFETPLTGAFRETREETGIKVETMEFCGILTETSPINYNWINYVYWAEIEKIPPPECNEGTLEWIHFNDILNIPTPKTDWFIYRFLLDKEKFVLDSEYDENMDIKWLVNELTGERLIG
ncbi:NUDIX hydrolase [Aquiflexum gelatinilyticum]|uniref:NUDIX hydrolase n=1 Tax=Aquiflexum gelatinilyticum TaxID=2961943 RepID=UPI0021679D79|nr:NUDIX domain-containing protein [Aquiflexum gelatinilyticum]MCS4432987.1 NUDIX domain-containing protein [Aquiflexum gelatinilyticum]